MFGFSDMMGNYESRKVDRFEAEDYFISTVMVTDALRPYETAISHPEFDNGDIVILEQYDTKEDAQTGHNKWVEKFVSGNIPNEVIDIPAGFEGMIESQVIKRVPVK